VNNFEGEMALFRACVPMAAPNVTAACLPDWGVMTLVFFVGLCMPWAVGVKDSETLTEVMRDKSRSRPDAASLRV
jgi:hypothetical protein